MDWLDKIISDAEPPGERAPGRALKAPRLRPYLPDKHALRRLIAGLAVLTRGAFGLLGKAIKAAFAEQAKKPPAEPEDGEDAPDKGKKGAKKPPEPKSAPWADMAERLANGALGVAIAAAVVAGALAAAGPRLLPYLPVATGVGVLGLLVAAWIVAPQQAPKKATPTASPGELTGFVLWLLQTIGDRAGIHLQELYPAMRSLPGHEGLSDAQLRAALTTLGVPVVRSVRVGRIAGRTGVRRVDVEHLASPVGERRVDSGGDAGQAQDSPRLSVLGEAL